jgi:hypothetical protein
LADIVKKGIPQAKSGGRTAANKAGMPAVGGSVVANASNSNTVLPSEGDSVRADKLPNGTIQVHPVPPGQGSDVPEAIAAASTNVITPRSFTPEVNEDVTGNLEQTKEMSANNTGGLTSSVPFSPSDKDLSFNSDLIETTDGYLPDKHSFEHSQSKLYKRCYLYLFYLLQVHRLRTSLTIVSLAVRAYACFFHVSCLRARTLSS